MQRVGAGRPRSLALTALVVIGATMTGGLVAFRPILASALLLGAAGVAVLFIQGRMALWYVFAATLGGAMVLEYGFANLGIHVSTLAVPLAEMVLGLLLVGAVFSHRDWVWRLHPVFPLLALLWLVTVARLLVDVPRYGATAVRDATLPIEASFVLVGYWATKAYGLRRWLAALPIVVLFVAGYGALFPWRAWLEAASPRIGLQHAVPLLGTYSSGAAAAVVASFFFVALFRPFRSWSFVVAALLLVEVILFQRLTLYLALPAIAVFVWLASGQSSKVRVRQRIVSVFAASLLSLLLVAPLAPSGRVGPVSLSFATGQVGTLFGRSGPRGGAVKNRSAWFHQVLGEVQMAPYGWLYGIGFGPALINFESSQGIDVRKPHNDYLEMFARTGIAGFVPFALILLFGLRTIFLGARRLQGEESRFLWWATTLVLTYMLIAGTEPLLAFPYGTVPLFSVLGAGVAVAEGRRVARVASAWSSGSGDPTGWPASRSIAQPGRWSTTS